MMSSRARARSKARALVVGGGSLLALFLVSAAARATVYYVSPTGPGTGTPDCTHDSPCALSYGAATAAAGDTVVLLDGTYANRPLTPAKSGTASAWITFQADPGAVPILDGSSAV